MNFLSVGDLSRFLSLRRANSALRNDIQALSKAVTTGVHADIPRHLGGDTLDLSRLEGGIRETEAFRRTTREAAATASGMQAAFGILQDIADTSSANMLSDTSLAVEHTLQSVASVADSQLGSAIDALNTNVGGRFLFSGMKANTPPIISASDLIAQAQSVIAGATSPAEAVQRLDTWFTGAVGSGGFSDNAYNGSLEGGSKFGIDASTTIQFEQTANDQGIRRTLLGLTLGALVSRGAFAGDLAAQAAMMRAGGAALMKGSTSITQSRAALGSHEQTIERTAVRVENLAAELMIERTNLISVDTYEVGSRLVQSEATLEALYAMTARLSGLSLAKHL